MDVTAIAVVSAFLYFIIILLPTVSRQRPSFTSKVSCGFLKKKKRMREREGQREMRMSSSSA